jgi:hypothetical protein
MLIHQQDYLVIDLEKNNDLRRHGDIKWEWFSLMLTMQVNGKLNRSKHTIFVFTGEQMNMKNKTDDDCNIHWDPKSYVIDEYWPIYAIFNLLHDIGYNLKENEQDYSYRGILPKIQEAIVDYYSDRHNLPDELAK